MKKKIYNYLIIIFITVVILSILSIILINQRDINDKNGINNSINNNDKNGITALEGREIADKIAHEWNTTATLVEVVGGGVDNNGRCSEWRYIYTNLDFDIEVEVYIFGNGTTKKYIYNRPCSYQPIMNWSIDSDELINIANKNEDIKEFLSEFNNAYIDSMQFGRGIDPSSSLICAIWWTDLGLIDNPHNANIKINANTGEVLEVVINI